MTRLRVVCPALAIAIASLADASSAFCQAGALEVGHGGWKADSISMLWSAGFRRTLAGPIDYSIALSHLDDRRSLLDRTQTGGELSMGVGRDGSGPYAVAGAGLGMKHYDGNIDAWWSAGAGWAVRVLPFLSVGLEARYRAEDQFSRGFWSLDPTDRRGPTLTVQMAILSNKGRRTRRAPEFDPPSPGEVERTVRDRGVSRDGSELASEVVRAALDAMGAPYRWGGEDGNGYDCSGLIQYAYGQHGIILPRVSREQARLGFTVDPRIEALHAGDILGFSVEGAGVTHVGLYIGEGQFIHSATGGVKLSSLTALDPDSAWWRRRWVQARRILQ